MKLRACVSVAALLAAGALPATVPAQEVGTVAAVNRDMTGTPPGATRRELDLGLDVLRNERVETSQAGSGQLLFLDQTTLTVSPNSDIVLDEYVYDPNAGAGDIALSVTRGALRLIGGRVTKGDPGIVRTPTATVGIRGGMAVIDVDDQGNTEVIHIAGEYTSVMQCGDADGNGVDDGCRPDEALAQVVLSRPNAMAEATRDGVEFTGLADADKLAQVYGKLEGQGQGGVDSAPSDTQVQGGTGQVATFNSAVPGGETNQPVSTTGEQPKSSTGTAEQSSEPTSVAQNTDPTVGGGAEDVEQEGALVPPEGAAFSEQLGYVPFTSTEAGSLIGRSNGEVFTIPVPDSPADLLKEHPEGAEFTPRAVALHPGAGLFPFDPETATSTTLGGLSGEFGNPGTAFADFDNEFVFVPFVAQGLGIAMFGAPTPGQGQFLPGDPGTAGAQTVDVYANEFGLDLGRSFLFIGGGGRNPVPRELFIVGKSGEPRFDTEGSLPGPETTTAQFIDGTGFGPTPTGRAIAAGFDIDGSSGFRSERLAIFVEPLLSSPATPAAEMQISGNGFVTLNQDGRFSFGEPAYGTFEDAQGHTLFGPDGNYFVLSSVHRERDGTLDTQDFGIDEAILSPVAPGVNEFESPFRASMFTRDPTRTEIIADPLALANQPGGFESDPGVFDGGFAAAIAICSSGNCGNLEEFTETPVFAGGYPLFSAAGPAGTQVSFDPNSAAASFSFLLSDVIDQESESNIAGAGTNAPPDAFLFAVGRNGVAVDGDAYGGYLDDERFAAVGTGGQLIAGNLQQGTVGLASAPLVGDPAGLFPSGVDTRPEYLRWGYWSATYQVTDGTSLETRTDLVPAGTFVVGNTPDPNTIPFAGSAEYSGFAVATAADIASRETRTIGGSFTLGYDFGSGTGQFDLSLPDFAVPNVSVPVHAGGHNLYGGSIDNGVRTADVQGAFFAGGGDPVAATAGNFAVEQGSNFAIGVYGGTSSGFVPGEAASAVAAAN